MSHSFIQFLIEKRSHAAQNPKVSVNQRINAALQKVVKARDQTAGIYNCFVSMTSVDKLGINPQSEYDTPIGIYAYPAIFVHKQVNTERSLDGALPFAGEMEHANIFSATGNIINLGKITDTEVVDLYKKIAAVFHKANGGTWKSDVDAVERLINEAPSKAKVSSLPGGRFWYVTMQVAERMARVSSTTPVMWNKLLRSIGVDGVVDMGNGIVHTNEPTQAVFFSTGAIGKIERVYNKYSPDAVAGKVELGKETIVNKAALVGKSDAELLDLVTRGVTRFEDIPHPSEALKLAAVKELGTDIQFIHRPSEEVQLAAVANSVRALQYIKNPSKAVLLQAVEHGPSNAIKYVKNPTEEILRAAVNAHPRCIRYIPNPSEALQLFCIRAEPSCISLIKNPTAKAHQLFNDIRNGVEKID